MLYDDLAAYADDLYAQVQYRQYFDRPTHRGYYVHAPAVFFASPSPDEDLILDDLNKIQPDDRCRLRVQMMFIHDSRTPVVDRLLALAAGGCMVEIAANCIDQGSLTRFTAAGIATRHAHLHDKMMLLYGNYDGTYQFRVWTGSQNIGAAANADSDELFVRLASEPTGDPSLRPIYNGFYRHFRNAYDAGEPAHVCSSADGG